MNDEDKNKLVQRIYSVFKPISDRPPMTLRSGNAGDSYDLPIPFDSELDQPIDQYLQQFASFALPHLDPVSWRYYLPYLMDFALRNFTVEGSAQSASCIERTLLTLRPSDRDLPRFALLPPTQEAIVVEFLDLMTFCEDSEFQDAAMQTLEEYWMPGALYRDSPGK